jgi:hypothetical protein
MGQMLETRRRMIRSRGRSLTITRGAASAGVNAAFQGFARAYSAGELSGGFQQGDMRLETLELPEPFSPPLKGDRVTIDGRTWTVMGTAPVYEGSTLIGYSVSLKGG